jgi:hypothetical protein
MKRLEAGRLEGWRVGRLEGWRVGRLEGWKVGRLEGWRVGGLEGWKVGKDGGLEKLVPELQNYLSFPRRRESSPDESHSG